jgi:hypothetical protein
MMPPSYYHANLFELEQQRVAHGVTWRYHISFLRNTGQNPVKSVGRRIRAVDSDTIIKKGVDTQSSRGE